ncbi:MAG: right-handed parallel beta-helix repeat-containing protein [Kiritimatiellia bacterium]
MALAGVIQGCRTEDLQTEKATDKQEKSCFMAGVMRWDALRRVLRPDACPRVTTLYVSPEGRDTYSGRRAKRNLLRTDGPLASLKGARDAVRKLKLDGQLAGPIRIVVDDGTYFISEALTLGPEDSGSSSVPITYEAAEGAEPVISGGRTVTGWKKRKNGIWTTEIEDVAAGNWYFEQLYVNGRRATRARYPNEFYCYMQDVQEKVIKKGKGKRIPERARQTIFLNRNDFDRTLGVLSADEIKDVQMQIYHKWDNSWKRFDRVDSKNAAVETLGRGMASWNDWHCNTRFHLENFRAALDAPGEWFLSRDGTLYYKPLPGEDMSTAEVIAPVTDKFLVVKGDPANGEFVEHITFRGLNFRYAEYLLPDEGFNSEQAAASLEATLQFDGVRNINVEYCEVAHIGIYAVWFRNACSDCYLRHCYLHDLGAGGSRIGQLKIPDDKAEYTHHITFDNNIIRQGGYIFPCAVGVWVGFSGDNQVTHNEIADLFYTGISVGWNWGYGPSLAKRNNFAYNNVHHIGQGVLSDMGGIYTLGLSEGTRVHDNVFHDIYAYTYGGWGLYTDQASTGIIFENNLVYNTKTGGFHQHFGKENIVRNNILAFAELYQIQASRPEEHLSFTLENNIVYYDEGKVLGGGAWKKARFISKNNCFWNISRKPVEFLGNSLSDWQDKGHEQGSIIADPEFTNAKAGDYTMAEDSPALKLGFKPFDYTRAGVYGSEKWRKLGAVQTAPPLKIAPAPPPITISYNYEHSVSGEQPSRLGKAYVENKGDAIVITDETASEGKQSLKFVDAEGLKHRFNPHYVIRNINYSEGRACNSFDLRIEPGAYLSFEWRDYKDNNPYKTGPKFVVNNGKLILPGGINEKFPLGKWVKFEISAQMSEKDGSSWSLKVIGSDDKPRSWNNLPFASKDSFKVDWIGFMSNAEKETVFYLDNFSMRKMDRPDKKISN